MRKPLEQRHQGDTGSHTGIAPANIPWEIYVACSNGESIDAATYIALHTTIDLDGLYDLLEMQQVHGSWANAAMKNAEQEATRRGNAG